MHNKKLSDLTEERRAHVKSCRTNGDKSHETIAGLYSDPSHFIYELLQNADDAKASKVIFNLTSESLKVTHNGKKLFDYKDVESITTVGSSTKETDAKLIGKFGAGFKSVFAVTKTPYIHSGDYHFNIVDFIVPEAVEPLDIKEQCTIIILPFNHSEKTPKDSCKKILERLKTLESESLLFLRKIREIQWSTESDEGHYLAKIEKDKASLISKNNEQDEPKDYLIFKKIITIDKKKLDIVVAYQRGVDDVDTIVLAQDPKLFVFFPTEIKAGLKFLVHAPYKTTPSRETIDFDDDQNKIITNKLSILIAESIESIKNNGLLNVNFLALLPINPENNHPLYSSAFQKVKEALTTHPLLPTSDDGYINAKDALLARGKALTTLLDSSDCSKLFGIKTWLSAAITSNKTGELRRYLMETLGITEITMEKFYTEITEEFIKTKDDQWLVNFYSSIIDSVALYQAETNSQNKGVLRNRPIIRLEDDSHICPENNSGALQVYLPSTRESKFKTVKRAIVESKEAIKFLESLGLKEVNDVAEIKELIIPKYDGSPIKKDEYLEDFARVLMIWSQSDEHQKSEIVDLLRQSQFVRCIDQKQSISYQKPDDVYFCTDELLAWYKESLDDNIYFLEVGIKLTENSRKFLESLGVRDDLKMDGIDKIEIHAYGYYKRSVNGFNPDFDIDGLGFSLNNITVERSILLWSVLLKHSNKLKGYIEKTTSKSRPYKKDKEQKSKVMKALHGISWLYGKDGQLIALPIDQIEVTDLNDKYQKADDNIDKLVKALGLKLDIVAKAEEETGGKFISKEEYEELEEFRESKRSKKAQSDDSDKDNEDSGWSPEVDPEEANISVDESSLPSYSQEDLSGQDTKVNTETGYTDSNYGGKERISDDNASRSKNSKEIGDWGESIANRYLQEKYPDYKVIWLNESGSVGKGYDFAIKDNGEEIAYYEVKSKTDEAPQLFEISGTQWGWARKLHNAGKGEMYKILLISNAGKKESKITEIINPIELWNTGKLYADPVKIILK